MAVSAAVHINFRGQARDALAFYQTVFGGDITVATYENIHQVADPAQADAVAWAQLSAPNGLLLMAYDVQTAKPFERGHNSFYVALRGADIAEIQSQWDALADGAEILIPIAAGAFGPLYGMLTDRFGITWIVNAVPSAAT